MRLFQKRAQEAELMDLGPAYYSAAEYERCLHQLGRIGRWLNGDRSNFAALVKLPTPPRSILDVGCGGGQFTRRVAERYPAASVTGIDIDQHAISFAQRQNEGSTQLSNLTYQVRTLAELDLAPKSVDVVMATLVCHHLSDAEIVQFVKQASQTARQAVIINDLHRHPLSWLTFSLVAPLFFPSRLIFLDGLLSIRKGFIRSDWINTLKAAGCSDATSSVTWCWPFRWLIMVRL